jgi:pimeloyl-ACP methyl ester carboxylesterase
MMFVDQSPLQNFSLDGWDARFCNRGMNGAPAVAAFQTALKLAPEAVLKDVIASCLSYRSHPLPTDNISPETFAADEAFFLAEALKGDPEWYGKLMSDHTSLDWRDSIRGTFGERNGSPTKVFVVASSRSGPFPSAGPLAVVDLVNNDEDGQLDAKVAKGVVIDWGGHWCYWEDPEKFNKLALDFFAE